MNATGKDPKHDEKRKFDVRCHAFTMMEVLVVLAILALLAGLAITNVGGIFSGAQESAAELFVRESLKAPLQLYQTNMGEFPSTQQGLNALINRPNDPRWKGPYVLEIPKDPWGEPYQYRSPAQKSKMGYDLWSKGKDKQDGTEDDIGNWSK